MKLVAMGIGMYACLLLSCRAKVNSSATESVDAGGQQDFQALTFAKQNPCLQVPANFTVPAGLPLGPDPKLSPGKLCDEGSNRRYPERILFCYRDVTDGEKNKVSAAYRDAGLLAATFSNTRDFKIDHYFSLCAGGSNDAENLWPQHKSIGKYTDPIEPRVCSAMHMGKMKQAEAVEIFKTVKADIKTAYDICKSLNARIGIN